MDWLISRFPELDHLEPDARASVLKRVPWWTYPLVIARSAFGSILIGGVGSLLLSNVMGLLAVMPVTLPLMVLSAISLYTFQLSRLREAMRSALVEYFRGRQVPFCFACGYDLRGSSEPRCPECGSLVSDHHTM